MDIEAQTLDVDAQSTRSAARTNLYLSATLIGEHHRHPVTVRNLSLTGALIRSAIELRAAGPIRLVRGSLEVRGNLVWVEGRSGGIQFADKIDLAAWAPGASGARQMEVDRMIARSRRQIIAGVAGVPPERAGSRHPDDLVRRIGEELAFASRKLDLLASALADDPAVIVRHASRLQDLDITTQVLRYLTALLGSDRPEALLPGIGMEDLRRRLERKSIG